MNSSTQRFGRLTGPAIVLLAAGAGGAALTGCRGERSDAPPRQFLPDMDDQQKFKPQSRTDFFADGRAMRPAVDGAVPFGRSTDAAEHQHDGFMFLKADDAFAKGVGPDGKYLDYIPESAMEPFGLAKDGKQAAILAMTQRGQQRFNIYCSACHGYAGEGATQISRDNPEGSGGLVGRRWSSAPASYHDPKYFDRSVDTGKDGYVFHTIREGVYDIDAATNQRKYRMPPYGHAVSETDAWAIVTYIRALQASWTTDLAAIPSDKRASLDKRTRPPAPPPIPAAPAPGAKPAAPGAPAPSTPIPAPKEGAK